MREIKFRQAIFKDNKFHHWHYWGYVGYNGDFIAPITIGQQGWNKTYEVKPSQQCTNLNDKSVLTKIYDGDILNYDMNAKRNYLWKVSFVNGEYVRDAMFGYAQIQSLNDEVSKFEVIGNIYENPELLEKVK